MDVGEGIQGRFGFGDGLFRIVIEQRKEGFGEADQVPVADRTLVSKGVTSLMIDRAECFRRMVCVHECTRTVVDRLARNGHVVSIHHAMDKAELHPMGDQFGLSLNDSVEQNSVRIVGVLRAGIVTLDCIVGEYFQVVVILAGGEPLKGADANVRRA